MSGAVDGAVIRQQHDPRFSAVIGWAWVTIGALALLIGVGMYNKLSSMNDTLLVAVSRLDTQSDQIKEMRAELSKQRDEIAGLRSQVYTLEGRTLRGIAEAARGH